MAINNLWSIVKISSTYDEYGTKTDSIIYKIETTDTNNLAYLMTQTHEQVVTCNPFTLTLDNCIAQVKLLVNVTELETFGVDNLNSLIIPIVKGA